MDAVGELFLGWSACTLEMGMWSLFHEHHYACRRTHIMSLSICVREEREAK